MKIKKSVLTLALALVLVFSFAAGAAAAGTLETISAYLNYGVTIKYNGETQLLKDAGGNRVYPITYNGTTYLPVRAVSNMLGVNVDWDQATQTVLLGEKKDGTDLIDTFKAYYLDWKCEQSQTTDKKDKDISGVNCSHWLEMGSWYEQTGKTREVSFNIGGKYDTVSFKYYSSNDCILRVLGDNDYVLWEKEVTRGQVAQAAVDVRLLNTSELTFQREETKNSQTGTLYVFDAMLK